MKTALRLTKFVLLASLTTLAACGSAPPRAAAPKLPATWATTKEGCKVWDQTPIEGDSATWDGACAGGYASGPGNLTWYVNGSYSQRFVGTMREGKRSGTGDHYWVKGDHYQGQFVEDYRTGKGTYSWPNGDTFTGDFVNGERNGVGVYTFANGDRFEGTQTQSAFIDGMLTDSGGEPIAKFVDRKRIALRYEPTQASGSSSGSGGAGFGAILGAIVQGLAMAGGKNAAQYQAVATAMNSTGNSSSGGAGVGSAYSASNAATGVNASSTNTQPTVNHCLSFTRSAKYTAKISNSCAFEVSMIYCYTNISNAAPIGYDESANACSNYRRTSSANVIVGASSFIEVSAPNNNSPVEYIACKSANNGYPEKLVYDGSKLNGQCHYMASSGSAGSRSFGAVK
jgi:hypothetical protein